MKQVRIHRAATRGLALLAALGLVVPCMLAPRSAQANILSDIGGGLCAVFVNGGHKCESKTVVQMDLKCDIKLGGASGVPNGQQHTYAFVGTCVSTKSGTVIRVAAKGTWDRSKYIADEAINVDKEGAGDLGGGVVTRFRCTGDPWISERYSVTCSVLERHATTLPNNFSYNLPATADYATLAEATELSRHHADVAPPPPPPPAAPPKTFRRPRVLTDNRRPAPDAIKGFAGGRGTVMQRKKNTGTSMQASHALAKFPPKVRVLQRSDKVDYRCSDLHKLITVRETLYNDGGPLAAHHATVYAKEDGGAHLGSRAIYVPPMAHGTRAQMTIPIGTSASYRDKLPGTHHVSVYLKVDNKPKAFFLTLSLPKGYCQPRLMKSPTNIRRNAGSGTGSRNPGTTSPTHRLTLPAR